MSRISLCMIVRNEERFLKACLESVRPWVDEICIVDTGSTDRTLQIAESFGCTIGHFAWSDDFSAARNASLELATLPWVFVIDADERLTQETGPALRMAVDIPDALAFLVSVDSLDENGTLHPQLLPRLFRNRPDIRFKRPLHESIMDSLFDLGATNPVPIKVQIVHHGYLPEIAIERNKHARNVDILRTRALDDPTDVFNAYKLAQTLSLEEEAYVQLVAFGAALQLAEELPAHQRSERPFLPLIYSGFAQALVRRGQLRRALDIADSGLAAFPQSIDLTFTRGDLARRTGSPEEALSYFEACLAAPADSPHISRDPRLATIEPALAIARLHFDARRFDAAREAVARVQTFDRESIEAKCLCIRLLFATGKIDDGFRDLESLANAAFNNADLCLLLGEVQWYRRDYKSSLLWFQKAAGSNDVGHTALAWFAMADIGVNGAANAESHLSLLADRDLTTAACRAILTVLVGTELHTDPCLPGERLRSHMIPWLEMLIDSGGQTPLATFHSNAARYAQRIPGIESILAKG